MGIAGPDIPNEARPGNWINSVGCQSDTGACFTSHRLFANTSGEKFTIGMYPWNINGKKNLQKISLFLMKFTLL